ncbi:hypothetical protein GCM10010191_83870 [Actinomadura vinacea]|uniref:Uncharacterized protein n=1 Tax=Actinomadura vinacea TaxID=115336 RepID=A0ABN3KBR3_9ACTN
MRERLGAQADLEGQRGAQVGDGAGGGHGPPDVLAGRIDAHRGPVVRVRLGRLRRRWARVRLDRDDVAGVEIDHRLEHRPGGEQDING